MSVKNIQQVHQQLNELADQLRGESGYLGRELDILSEGIASIAIEPPGMSTKDIDAALLGEELKLEDPARGQVPVEFERLIQESDLLPASFLELGALRQRAVARVVLTKPHTITDAVFGQHTFPPGTGWATGFLVSPSLLLTNNHVIPDEAFVGKIRLQFNFQLSPDGIEQPTESFFPVVDEAFHTNVELDYTMVRLKKGPTHSIPPANFTPVNAGEQWGYIALNPAPIFQNEQHVNIIQHPRGRRKEIAIQDNKLVQLFVNRVRYTTDTEPASSGSPVFDNFWELIALHHAGGEKDNAGNWVNNQGIPLNRIVDNLRDHFSDNQSILDELEI